MGGNKVKRYLKILKGFVLVLVLFASVCAIGVCDGSYKASVKIVQVSTEDDDKVGTTTINTYMKESSEPAGIQVTAKILGSGEKTITDKDGVVLPEGDETPAKSPVSITKPTYLEPGESIEEFSDDVYIWIQYMLDETQPLAFYDFPANVADIINAV